MQQGFLHLFLQWLCVQLQVDKSLRFIWRYPSLVLNKKNFSNFVSRLPMNLI